MNEKNSEKSAKQTQDKLFTQFLLSLRNTIWRIVVYLDALGLKVPGLRKARKELETETVAHFDRKKILRSLKSARFQTQWGPIWFRPIADSLFVFWELNRFWINFFAKLCFGVAIVSLPFALFVLIRGVLPVPERVSMNLRPTNSEGSNGFWASYQPFSPVEGSSQISTSGALPRKLIGTESFVLSQKNSLKLFASRTFRPSISGRSFVRLDLQAHPQAQNKDPEDCEITIKDEKSEELFRGVLTKDPARGRIASEARRLFQSRFTPQFDSLDEHSTRITVDTLKFPAQLILSVHSLRKEFFPDSCAFIVGAPTFQFEETFARKGTGVLIVVAEGLGLSDELPDDWQGRRFLKHHVLHSQRSESLNDLLELEEPTTLAQRFSNEGFATFYAGKLHRTDLNEKGFQTVIGLETPEYNARHTTEEFAQWMFDLNGSSYFATLKYDLLTPPYRPPFAKIDLLSLLKNPFGLKRERSLRNASNMALNSELSKLKQHMIAQNRWDSTWVILTSNAPLHLTERDWIQDQNIDNGLGSAARNFTASTWETDTRVPLIWKSPLLVDEENEATMTSGIDQDGAKSIISFPTSHENFAFSLKEQVFSKKNNLESIWPRHTLLPLIGEDEVAIIDYNEKTAAQKYVFPFRPQKVALATKGFPFREVKVLAPQERITTITNELNEVSLENIGSHKIQQFRQAMLKGHFPQGTPIKYVTYHQSVLVDQDFLGSEPNSILWAQVPDGLQLSAIEPSTQEIMLQEMNGQSTVHKIKTKWKLKGTMPPNSILKMFWKEKEVFVKNSLPAKASLCGGAWLVSWATLLKLSADAHPCLLQEDRMKDLLDFRTFSLQSPAAMAVSFFHD
jgi:hypothetical protein